MNRKETTEPLAMAFIVLAIMALAVFAILMALADVPA
jgi:hypothetical protein